MPFTMAGGNWRHRDTGIRGWTRPQDGHRRFALARLIRFDTGDYAWRGARFLAWGEQVVLGTWPAFQLRWEHQHGLPQSEIR